MRNVLVGAAALIAGVCSVPAVSATTVLDTFDRADTDGVTGLTGSWSAIKGGMLIDNNMASGGSQGLDQWTGGGYSGQTVGFDFYASTVANDTRGYYVGALLDWNGTSGYFIKIQHQALKGAITGYNQYSFGHVTVNPTTKVATFTNDSAFTTFATTGIASGHLEASVTNKAATLKLTGLDGALLQTFNYSYTTDYAGTGIGIGVQDGGRLDNFAAIAAAPEPASWAMMVAGFGIVGVAARRKKTVSARIAA